MNLSFCEFVAVRRLGMGYPVLLVVPDLEVVVNVHGPRHNGSHVGEDGYAHGYQGFHGTGAALLRPQCGQ